ncbi:MAG: restriction endonuclease [Lacrimispora sphenoides]
MMNNYGEIFENDVYELVKQYVDNLENSLVTFACFKHKPYYSRDRENDIITDVSIEVYINKFLFIIIVFECKAYKKGIPVDDAEEFHSKLQQIGADNTKGIMIAKSGKYQSGTLKYAKSKGITLLSYKDDFFNDFIGMK